MDLSADVITEMQLGVLEVLNILEVIKLISCTHTTLASQLIVKDISACVELNVMLVKKNLSQRCLTKRCQKD